MRDAILESEVGPKILYHFAKNPDEAERIGKLSVAKALKELGKLEATLQTNPVKTGKNPVSQVSKEVKPAVEPISPLRGANAPVEPAVGSDGKFKGSYAEWKAARKAGKIR